MSCGGDETGTCARGQLRGEAIDRAEHSVHKHCRAGCQIKQVKGLQRGKAGQGQGGCSLGIEPVGSHHDVFGGQDHVLGVGAHLGGRLKGHPQTG